MGSLADWEVVGPLGSGGQSKVSLVRSPKRRNQRSKAISSLRKIGTAELIGSGAEEAALSVWHLARPDLPSELAALKQFNIPPEGAGMKLPPGSPDSAIDRLRNEIAVLELGRKGLPKLLDSNEGERWIVTEYFERGTLEEHPSEYRGQALRALNAFRSLVSIVAELHEGSYIHRDIKPPNIFLSGDSELVLGDFGIVYSPSSDRVTRTGEKVGPRDYMPPWAHLGRRIDEVHACWDVYMLGKLLWCMIDGRSFLPREYFSDPDFDLTRTFPGDPGMYLVKAILEKCLVERPSDCLASARLLLLQVEEALGVLARGGQIVSKGTPRFCRVCGRGVYEAVLSDSSNAAMQLFYLGNLPGSDRTTMPVRPFSCTGCGHIQIFPAPIEGS